MVAEILISVKELEIHEKAIAVFDNIDIMKKKLADNGLVWLYINYDFAHSLIRLGSVIEIYRRMKE